MSNDEQNVFSFHLNESLWFQKGQEVDEFMGISLEPEITIQELDDSVSIRGVIELTGEYYQVKEEIEQDLPDFHSLQDDASKRMMQDVEMNEDGVNECYHRFPVEISIPKHRIDTLDDVTVNIDAFDYELPEKGQLKLNATVAIHGVKQEEAEQRLVDSHQPTAIPHFDLPLNFEERFQLDMKYTEDDVAHEHEGEEVERTIDNNAEATEVEREPAVVPFTEDEEIEEVVTEEEKGRWKYKQTQTLAEFFNKDETLEQTLEDEIVENVEDEDTYEQTVEEEDRTETEEDHLQDFGYLTAMFQDEEEPYAKMRMCIVQETDTLGSIAQKYKIPPTQISRVNDLGDEDVTTGQILYIPTK
ncbi:stage VI sporulation protein D [Pontibacillus litoralis]|uniref:Stage VI sporulation protein D n=1 Tax=Pontibacillus litoralis JSM 072002 TaxID=1385512 RepID=A0A0A5GCW9_9BACI|nr:stage VI sporulation protein D [Pontibacillus litoralis]KGX89023.1 stage VI sporulation protein D [Pontibacillus litoralis JSM 072002]